MSILISARVKRKVAGSSIKKSILKELADYASDDGTGIWASKTNMAQDLEVTRRTIIRAISQFVDVGLLIEVGKRPCSNGYTVEYKIDLDVLDSLEDTREAILKPVKVQKIKSDRIDYEGLIQHYNEIATEVKWSLAQSITSDRKSALRARVRECGGEENWKEAIILASKSSFLTSKENNWSPNLDFFNKQSSFVKLMEGVYNDKNPNNGTASHQRRVENTTTAAEVADRTIRYAESQSAKCGDNYDA
jgi:hypothetical protein